MKTKKKRLEKKIHRERRKGKRNLKKKGKIQISQLFPKKVSF